MLPGSVETKQSVSEGGSLASFEHDAANRRREESAILNAERGGRRRGKFSPGLEAARGIAALGVVVFHALLVFQIGGIDDAYRQPIDVSQPWLIVLHTLLGIFNGPACVTLFFVLSGTVLALSLDRESRLQPGALLGYWIRRGFRLYPLLILAAACGALLQFFYFDGALFRAATTWLNQDFKISPGAVPKEFVKNAVGLSSSLNSPAWSIKIELVASAIFPLLYVLSKHAKSAAATLLVLIVLMFAWPSHVDPWANMHVFTVCFFVGALIPCWGRPLADWFYGSTRAVRRLVAIGSLATLMFASRLLAPGQEASSIAVFIETLSAGLLVTIILFGPERRLYNAWSVRTLGQISYGVYLTHLLILNVIARTALPMLPQKMSAIEAFGCTVLLAIATLAVTLPLAYILYHWFEHPLQQLGRQIGTKLAGQRRLTTSIASA